MHDIYFLWSHPRSLSSALQRVMVERGDLQVFHEPFLYVYYIGAARRSLPMFEPDPDHPVHYADVKDMILKAARQQPVFVKDMCYYATAEFCADPAFLARIRSCFLIRHPARSIASYAKLDPELTLEEIGLEAQWRVFETVTEVQGGPAPVIDADDLQRDPSGTVRALCDGLGLEHREDALSWQGLPADWHFVSGWHEGVGRSIGIQPRDPGPLPSLHDDTGLQAMLKHHLPFYSQLRQHCLRS